MDALGTGIYVHSKECECDSLCPCVLWTRTRDGVVLLSLEESACARLAAVHQTIPTILADDILLISTQPQPDALRGKGARREHRSEPDTRGE